MITVFGSYVGYRRATQTLWAPTSDTTMSDGPSAARRSKIARWGVIGQPASVSCARSSASSAVRRSALTRISRDSWRSVASRPPTPRGQDRREQPLERALDVADQLDSGR